ncbi:DUF3035 domain-containing protein [Rhodophyticola porphyridii]|uniref:DUF3035 domain-containing protein n=1 Tax=Rhodophyticola porphyridii TaxID=1852017 RepID=A0A3L9Y9H4_9RHOB|nr:DUF3035 domain-containing protein [Rhodophyticola porphyridii]RMA42883.1 DUF3035 domain-containing protein [Rhodophyticola porphyridii]
MMRWRGLIATGLVLVMVAGCSRSDPRLLNITADGDGPDEFSILPTRPLEMPPSFAELPPPTPGGPNRVDPDPEADAIAALGGNIDRASRDNGGLVGYAGRFGIGAGIRETLASEDLEYRRDNDGRLLERVFNVNVYHRAYGPLSLDQYAELERMRRAGIRTPAAPPEPAE